MATKKKKKNAASKKSKSTAPPKKRNKKRNATKKQSLFWRLVRWVFILAIWGTIALAAIILWFAKDLPDITKSATFERRASIVVMANDNSVLARYGESKGKNISVNQTPDTLIHAVLATEDRRFYSHPGIDLLGISRAMVTNIAKGRLSQGGSTITQQLAKNLFLSHDRTVTRKIKEAILAIWLENELTKDEILSAYMNRVYLGSGTYGFDAAAQLYFDKSVSEVNLYESAILAGLLKAPSKYSPHNNTDLTKKRADTVIAAMIDAGYITKSDLTQENMNFALPNKNSSKEKNIRYFTDWVIDGLDEIVGSANIDMIVHTTLDPDIQKTAQNNLISVIDNAKEEKAITQGGIIAMRPDGAITAMVGGYNYGQSQFNRTTQAIRPPGSSFKPFVYLAALQSGWKPNDIILDAPITEGQYRPKNFANAYFGEVTLEQSITKSMNTSTVRLAQEIGIGNVIKTANKAGIISPLNRDLSLALGSSGVPILELATAYTTFANGGYRVFPYAITKITDAENDDILYIRKTPKSYVRIFDKDDIRDLSQMLQSVINNGTGKGAQLPYPASGKTGTSQESRDAWFAGYTNNMTCVVWLGNDDNSPMNGVTGGSYPARIWKSVMLEGNKNYTPPEIIGNNQNNNGFSNMLNRLFSGSSHPNGGGFTPRNDKNAYGNLNR